jgi:hypothetical protein
LGRGENPPLENHVLTPRRRIFPRGRLVLMALQNSQGVAAFELSSSDTPVDFLQENSTRSID